MQGEVLIHKEEQSTSKKLHVSGGQEVATCGYDASKDLESPCSGDCSHGDVRIEETGGSCFGQKEHNLLSLFVEAYGLEVEEELSIHHGNSALGRRNWRHEQKEAWMRQVQEVQTWKQVRGPAGAVMCETRDLVIK